MKPSLYCPSKKKTLFFSAVFANKTAFYSPSHRKAHPFYYSAAPRARTFRTPSAHLPHTFNVLPFAPPSAHLSHTLNGKMKKRHNTEPKRSAKAVDMLRLSEIQLYRHAKTGHLKCPVFINFISLLPRAKFRAILCPACRPSFLGRQCVFIL